MRNILIFALAGVALYFVFLENRNQTVPAKPDPFSPSPQNTAGFAKGEPSTVVVRQVPAEML